MCAGQPRLDKSLGGARMGGSPPSASLSGKYAGFGCLIWGQIPPPQLPTQRIKQIGGSGVIASW